MPISILGEEGKWVVQPSEGEDSFLESGKSEQLWIGGQVAAASEEASSWTMQSGGSEMLHTVTTQERCLYVHQGEIVIGVPQDSFDVVGSDDATTCIIFLARCISNNKLLVSHIDTAERSHGLEAYIDALAAIDASSPAASVAPDSVFCTATSEAVVDVYISGGLQNDDGSEELLAAIIAALEATSVECRIQLLAACKHNSAFQFRAESGEPPLAFPRVPGCAFVRGQVKAASFPVETRGPNSYIRQASIFCTEGDEFRVISRLTDDGQFLLKLTPYENSLPKETLLGIASLPDAQFLQETSSSPHCEPLTYVSEMRQSLQVLINEEEQALFGSLKEGSEALLYRHTGAGGTWERVA